MFKTRAENIRRFKEIRGTKQLVVERKEFNAQYEEQHEPKEKRATK